MKYFKLFICFVIFTALIVGAVFLSTGSKSSGSAGINIEYYNEVDSIINAEWQNKEVEWNRHGFDKMHSKINVYKRELGRGYNTQLDKFYAYALSRLYTTTVNQYSQNDCKKDKIDSLNSDLKYIVEKANGKFDNNKNVMTLQKVYKLYGDALHLRELYDNCFAYNVHYSKKKKHKKVGQKKNDTTVYYLRDVNGFLEGRQKAKGNIVSNNYYKYICNIDTIKKAFDEKAFNERIEKCRQKWKALLEKDILKAFRGDIPKLYMKPVADKDSLKKMERILDEINEQYSILLGTIEEYQVDFGKDSVPSKIKELSKEFTRAIEKYNGIIEKTKKLIDDAN